MNRLQITLVRGPPMFMTPPRPITVPGKKINTKGNQKEPGNARNNPF